MREPRNPFRLRASEQIESDATFLQLFEPGILDLLPDNPWEQVWLFRSAPGGGKTSLMRLFTPGVLLSLHASQGREECRDLYQRLRAMGAFDDGGPRVLGVPISCARNYATLADLDLDDGRKQRLLYALLNARILLNAARGALQLRRLQCPGDLPRLMLAQPSLPDSTNWGLAPRDGPGLFEWAQRIEHEVCRAIDSFRPVDELTALGHETLESLRALAPEGLTIDGAPVASRVLLMLDDAHKLTTRQRRQLLDTLVETRVSVGVWVAERFEALTTSELLSSGAAQGRDYGGVVPLERFWRDRSKRFETLLLNIADRRARSAVEGEVGSFRTCLVGSLEQGPWRKRAEEAASVVAERLRAATADHPAYSDWIRSRETESSQGVERLWAWRSLEILVEREKRRAQRRFDFAPTAEELETKDDSAVRAAAEVFASREFELPYYFGGQRLASLASSNIEQFLALGGDEFEEVVSAALLRRPTELAPERQEAIITRAGKGLWEEIPRRVRCGRDVVRFLDGVGSFCKWSTYQPNAPYSPGVTGIALPMSDRERLADAVSSRGTPQQARLAAVLSAALANNLLEAILDYKCKGQLWMVLYLNRLLCVRFHLPLHYGGFREKSLRELHTWLEEGFVPPKAAKLL